MPLGALKVTMLGAAGSGGVSGWIAQYETGIAAVTAIAGYGCSAIDSNDDLIFSFALTDSASTTDHSVIVKINTEAGTITDNKEFAIETTGGADNFYSYICSLNLDPSDNIFITGWSNIASTGDYSIWRVKLNSSYVEQWNGSSSGDQMKNQSGYDTYANTSQGGVMSPNGNFMSHQGYGYTTAYSSYNYMSIPVDVSNGNQGPYAASYTITDASTPTSLGCYMKGSAMNNVNIVTAAMAYHSGYGGYHNPIWKTDYSQYNGAPAATAMRLSPSGTGGMGGGYFANLKPSVYHGAGDADRYPMVGHITGGTYSTKGYFFRWNHATGWATFDQGYLFTVNAADSPATPTDLSITTKPVFESTDTDCFFIFRDNGNTPTQNYLVRFTPAASAGSIDWQNKILVYRTADGSGVQNAAYAEDVEISSDDEWIYTTMRLTTNSVDRPEALIFKLPADGTGTGTYVVGDYTVVYGTSNMTGAAGDIIASATANTFTNLTQWEGNTSANAVTSHTGTFTTVVV